MGSHYLSAFPSFLFRCVSPAQSRFHQRNKLTIGKRFDDKIVSANFHRFDGLRNSRKAADHDKGDVLKTFQQLETAETRHPHIADDEIRARLLEVLLRFLTVG